MDTEPLSEVQHGEAPDAAGFAAKATDLSTLRDAVVDAATVGSGLWLSYLFTFFYLMVAAGAVTHKDLFLEGSVKLPFLDVELPLVGFFILGPLLFVILHAYTLLHFTLLADKVGAFDGALREQIADDDIRTRLRRQLPSNIFVQFLAGPQDIRHGPVGLMLRLIAVISLVVAPVLLLVFFELQFLPYHSELISWWQRIMVVADLLLLWVLWPSIAAGRRLAMGWRDFYRPKPAVCLAISLLPLLLVFTIATFPGEWLDDHVPSIKFPAFWRQAALGKKVTSLHELLVGGGTDFIKQRPTSLWSNRLVLPAIDMASRAKGEGESKSSTIAALRGRNLESAILFGASLRAADFTGARLRNATFVQADLRDAIFKCETVGETDVCADLQGASFRNAQLQGATFERAGLQGALFDFSQLQGASFKQAHLQGASIEFANAQGALLASAELEGASLKYSHLQAAVFTNAQLQSASLEGTQLQSTALDMAQLQGAILDTAQLQGASLAGAQLQGASLNEANLSAASLQRTFVWRTHWLPPQGTARTIIESTRVVQPEAGATFLAIQKCQLVPAAYLPARFAALKRMIEPIMADSSLKSEEIDKALKQLDTLNPEDLSIDAALDPPATRWQELTAASPRDEEYETALAASLQETGCAADGAPYVIHGLLRRLDPHLQDRHVPPSLARCGWRIRFAYPHEYLFSAASPHPAALARAFLDETTCPGARGLSEEDKGRLREVIAKAAPAAPKPGAQTTP